MANIESNDLKNSTNDKNNFHELTFADFIKLRDENVNIGLELFNINPSLLRYKEVFNYICKQNKEIPDFIVDEVIRNKIEINFDDVKKHESIRNNRSLIYYAYNNDARVFLLFPAQFLTYQVSREAVSKDVVASEEDIIFNPALKDMAPVMEAAIQKDSKLIKYVTTFCGIQLSDDLISAALSNYQITKEDLYNNPELCSIFSIISKLPEYRLYSSFLTDEEKMQEIEDLLKSKNYDAICNLPFFQEAFKSNVNKENIRWIVNLIATDIAEEDLFEQKYYQRILDFIVDGIVVNMYHKEKFNFVYPDTVAMANDLKKFFFKAEKINSTEPLEEFAIKLNDFVAFNSHSKNFISYDYLISRVEDLYNNYLIDESSIFNNNATIFYNELLNFHRNGFCSIEKNKILTKLKYKLSLTNKKKDSINNGKKLIKIAYLLATQKYDILGITKNELEDRLIDIEKKISSNADLLKDYGVIKKEVFDYFKTYFLNSGQLDYLTISHMLGTSKYEVIQYIFKKYEQIKVDLLDKVELSKEEQEIKQEQISKIGFNVVNFKIANYETTIRNIATLLLRVNDEEINKIKLSASDMGDILKIISFADILPNFDVETVLKIFCNYSNIKNTIIKNNFITSNDMAVISRFSDVIGLANGYDSMSNFYELVLGKNVFDKIDVVDIKEYYDFYAKVRNKINTSIPRVSFGYGDYLYESGNHFETERLIIGKSDSPSCIDLVNTGGKDTYIDCLTGTKANVITIRNKEDNSYYGRILIFREGNIIQMACAYNHKGKKLQYPDEFYKIIAEQIITQANEVGDNIDYVFLTKDAIKETNFDMYENVLFETAFPHSDFWKYSYLVASNPLVKDKDLLSNLDFFGPTKCLYPKVREDIKEDAFEGELTRLKALRIATELDGIKRNELEKNFRPFYKNEFEKVISGEDWYIAIRSDGSTEELILPTNDDRAVEEFENAKKLLNLGNYSSQLIRK